MPELRQDLITGRWVIISEERLARPQEFEAAPLRKTSLVCPFCRGHEEQTPPAVWQSPDPIDGGEAWRVRVTPNKYAALALDGADKWSPNAATRQPVAAFGAHEVVIEAPTHLASVTQLPVEHFGEVFAAYRARLAYYKAQRAQGELPLVYGLVFKNSGPMAGASLEHVHSQIAILPLIPETASVELTGSARYFAQSGRCVFCQLLAEEQVASSRVVAATDNFLAFCPYASRFPLETWIVPTGHASHFETTSDALLAECAALVQKLLGRLETILPQAAYNYFLHTAPLDTLELDHYHWHIEIAPRVAWLAGLELGSGLHLNPVTPEHAAAQLRGGQAARVT